MCSYLCKNQNIHKAVSAANQSHHGAWRQELFVSHYIMLIHAQFAYALPMTFLARFFGRCAAIKEMH